MGHILGGEKQVAAGMDLRFPRQCDGAQALLVRTYAPDHAVVNLAREHNLFAVW